MKKRIFTLIGAILIIVAFVSSIVLDIPTFVTETVKFSSTYKGTDVTLEGTYKEVDGSEYAALICPGYSCDRQKWRPMMDLLVSDGITTMSFDYAGQGASSSTIGFDNAKTDSISEEIADAIEYLHEKSGIDYDHIILIGHSMGGRAILRLLYDYNDDNAETNIERHEISNVILISPEVNYSYNAQASLFAGTSDANEEPWKDYNESYTSGVNVFIYGSTSDDIVSDEDIWTIYEKISGADVQSEGTGYETQINSVGSTITAGVVSGVLHSYEMYSPQFASLVNDSIESITGNESVYNSYSFLLVYISWIAGLVGVGLLIIGISSKYEDIETDNLPTLENSKKFIGFKALMWLPGLVMAFIICCICVILPFGSPVMNIPYMCFIAGYGIVMAIAYSKGKFGGTKGKMPKLTFKVKQKKTSIIICVALSLVLVFFVWFVLYSTMYKLIPLNFRIFWVIFAAILMTFGYYISSVEREMLKKSNAGKLTMFLYNLIQYFPLLLLVAFYAILKSWSGMIGQIQNLLLMYLFCVPLGDYIRKRLKNRLIGSLVTGFLFQTIMITSAALIAIF